MEDPSLSRRSSLRSTSGSMPTRDRPDSVTVFGKSIFSRKAKQRRDTTDPNLSGNALFPPGMAVETPREQRSMAALFSRRKSVKGDETATPQKKKLISEPYNFQHLTHTQKDNLPNLQQASRMDLVSEFSCIRAGQKPTMGSLKGIQADDLQLQRLSAELLSIKDFEPELDQAQLLQDDFPPISPRDIRTGQFVRRDSSVSQIGPSGSLEDTIMAPFSPPAPPRVPGHMSLRFDGFRLLPATDPDYLSPNPMPPRRQSEPHIYMTSRRTESPDLSHAISTPDDAAWPLCTSAMCSLPELPEEEESPTTVKDPVNIPTNLMSLKGSISVPALRKLSLSQATERAPSDASETLGKFEVPTIRRVARAATNEWIIDHAIDETWEDDIDYCYEHAAEADCDFAWERPSCDLSQVDEEDDDDDDDLWESQTIDYRVSAANSPGTFSPEAVSPRASAAPSRGSANQMPIPPQSRTVTPAMSAGPVTSNFSLPQRAHNRTLSRSDSFRERARGLSLSPTFFISNDHQQQIPEYDEKEELQDQDDDDDDDDDDNFLTHLPTTGSSLQLDKKIMLLHARSSASTDNSAFSDHSLSSDRHKSNGSINTALTGWTVNSACASLDGWPGSCETSQLGGSGSGDDEEQTVMGRDEDVVSISPEPHRPSSRHDQGHERHRSDADLLMKAALSGTANTTVPPIKTRRRARTTSRSHNSPQLALFPHVPSNTRRP